MESMFLLRDQPTTALHNCILRSINVARTAGRIPSRPLITAARPMLWNAPMFLFEKSVFSRSVLPASNDPSGGIPQACTLYVLWAFTRSCIKSFVLYILYTSTLKHTVYVPRKIFVVIDTKMAAPQYTFPAPIGGVPFDLDFAPSILFAVLYGSVSLLAIYRMAHPSTRTLCTLGSFLYVTER